MCGLFFFKRRRRRQQPNFKNVLQGCQVCMCDLEIEKGLHIVNSINFIMYTLLHRNYADTIYTLEVLIVYHILCMNRCTFLFPLSLLLLLLLFCILQKIWHHYDQQKCHFVDLNICEFELQM